MRVLYCNDDLEPGAVDSCFVNEAHAATDCGFLIDLIDFNAIRQKNADRAVRHITRKETPESAVYRGWMLTPEEYRCLYAALETKNVRLLNSPNEYLHCHWFPNSYSLIKENTPFSVWLPAGNGSPDCGAVMEALKPFGASPVVVKDYVKSRKHEWYEACFIPDASDKPHVRSVVERFLELQGEDLQGGLVFREFVEFEPVGNHPNSGMPLTLEYRVFVLRGKTIAVCPYWDMEYGIEQTPVEQFATVFTSIKSRFFSCDIAKTTAGQWLIVELGDGQVAGLPDGCDISGFYEELAYRFDTEGAR